MGQEVLIEFITSTEGLEPAVDQLERLGAIDKATAAAFKATNSELAKKAVALKTAAAAATQSLPAAKKSIDDVDKAVNKLTQDFVEGFQEGVTESLKEAGVSVEEFEQAMNKTNASTGESTKSLRGQLRDMTQQLARMKIEGKDNSVEYQELAQKAGELQDAIADANQEVKNFGSDTGALDGLISTISGVAGGFAVVQGTQALFGAESEELQETLLRVNSAMAILQGLQQIQTVLQKESAAATFLQTTGQKIYNIVIGQSIGLTAAFRVALAATGIGLLILGVVALVEALKDQQRELDRVNDALARNKSNIEADTRAIEDLMEIEVARAKAAGAIESDLTAIRGRSLQAQRAAIVEANKSLAEQRSQVDKTSESFFKLDAAIEGNNERIKEIDLETRTTAIELIAQQREEALKSIADQAEARLASTRKNSKAELDAAKSLAFAKAQVDLNAAGQDLNRRLAIEANLQKELLDLQRSFDQVRQQDRIAGIETALTAEQAKRESITIRQGQAEIDLQKKIIQQKANLELLQEGLTQNQILQIKTNAQTEILRIQREFNRQTSEQSLQDFISGNNAQLAVIEITNQEKLQLTIDNIIAQAAIEEEQNLGLSAKIKEINAKRDADIKAVRIQSIRDTVAEEIELRQSIEGATIRQEEKELAAQDQLRNAVTEKEKRALEIRLNVRRLSLQEEFNLIDSLAQHETDNINAQIKALNTSLLLKLISYKQYTQEYNALTDQQAKIVEDSEQKKRDAAAATEKAAKDRQRRIIEFSIDAAKQTLDLVSQLFQNQADREQNHIDRQREQIAGLREAGAITEKEETQRLKKLDEQERKLKIQQAKRNKVLAIFNAVISTAQAVATALTAGPVVGPILAAITAALGAVQIGLIASRPIPAFKTGKKNNYEGPGIVGEAGAELIERDGQLFVAPKKTIVWLGAKDKVFNPAETIAMLEKPGLQTARIEKYEGDTIQGERIDYDKLGKVIAKNTQGVSLNIDGYKDFVMEGHAFTTYLNNRRGFK